MQGDILTASNITATIDGYGVLGGQLSAAGTIAGSLRMCETISASINGDSEVYALVDSNGDYITNSSGEIITGRTRAVRIGGDLSAAASISGTITVPSAVGGDPYTGSYEVTPSTNTQTIPTSGKVMYQNVTVKPIPSNYGLITWNGSTLTVS